MKLTSHSHTQKYSRPRCLLRVKGLVIFFYLGWSGSILQFKQNIIKVGSKSWLLTCSSDITLSSPSYTGSALKIFVTAILVCCIFALYTQNIIFGILRIHNQIVTIPISTLSKSAQCHPCQSDRSHTLSIFAREVLITTTRTSSSMQSKVLNKLKGLNNRQTWSSWPKIQQTKMQSLGLGLGIFS